MRCEASSCQERATVTVVVKRRVVDYQTRYLAETYRTCRAHTVAFGTPSVVDYGKEGQHA